MFLGGLAEKIKISAPNSPKTAANQQKLSSRMSEWTSAAWLLSCWAEASQLSKGLSRRILTTKTPQGMLFGWF